MKQELVDFLKQSVLFKNFNYGSPGACPGKIVKNYFEVEQEGERD